MILLDAVDELTKPENRHLAQKDDFGRWIKVHTITAPPLLQRMHDAVHPSSNKTTGSASSASTRSPADLDAMFQYAKMTAQIGDWCRSQNIPRNIDPVRGLRHWYTTTLIKPVHEPFYIRQLQHWAGIIRNHLDPPETFTAKHACPVCLTKGYGDAINGGDSWPIEIRYRKDETDRMVDEVAMCRACRATWRGHDAVMELAEEVNEKTRTAGGHLMPYMSGAPAYVVAYSGDSQAVTLDIKIECRACQSEWGWASDVPSENDKLEAMAESHNREVHGWDEETG